MRIFLLDFVSKNTNGKTVVEQIKETLKTHSNNEDNISSIFKLITHLCEDEGTLTKDFHKYLSDLSAQDDNLQAMGQVCFRRLPIPYTCILACTLQ